MKIVAFVTHSDDEIHFGHLAGERVIGLDDPFAEGEIREDGKVYDRADCILTSPCFPTKALCIGLNYADHAREFGLSVPDRPVVFMKPASALCGPGDYIIKPSMCRQLDEEAELAIVIGKECHEVDEAEADSYILGYCCANDVTARDMQPKQGQWTLAKGFDTFMPLGPYIETEVDPDHLAIECRINGKTVQKSNTENLIFKPRWLVSYLSQVMTLLPGDVILTGTPSGTSRMEVGDEVSVTIEGLGSLTNTVDA